MLKSIPGLGVIVMVLGLLLTGVFATNIAGQWALKQGGRVVNRIPIVKSIYSSVKQVSDTLFSSSGNASTSRRTEDGSESASQAASSAMGSGGVAGRPR
jgi:uncharacterized membrane protein